MIGVLQWRDVVGVQLDVCHLHFGARLFHAAVGGLVKN
jgi:hypothetical protein